MYRTLSLVVTLALFLQTAVSGQPSFRLAPLFADNMVLQQKSNVPVWGNGTPGTSIVIHASWKKNAEATVLQDGTWSVSLPTPSAGGPYTLTIQHDNTATTITNVLIGEVWLCSGQSNMEMPLTGWPPSDTILYSADEIKSSKNSNIRFFTVRRAFSAVPQASCSGEWSECSPQSAPSFSATAYFFGKELNRVLNVPIGLIHSSWGGTPVEAWTRSGALKPIPGFDSTLEKITRVGDAIKTLDAWLAKFPVIDMQTRNSAAKWENLDCNDHGCEVVGYDDSRWGVMQLPVLWEKTDIGEFDGVVWFRKTVTVPAAWKNQDLVLELGPIDDMDASYVNGKLVGRHETEGFWKIDRVYNIPKSLVDTTVLHIAVRVIDNGGGGGIYGEPKSMRIHPEGSAEGISIAGEWKYLPVADFQGDRFYVFGAKGEGFFNRPKLPMSFGAYTATSLYNGMIAPLVPYRLAGVIWYQGEANTGAPELYKTLFPTMIENWRSDFQEKNLPFYYVQIAPWQYGPGTESAYLREAQFATLKTKNTGMAVTMDIGNPNNIHPANKTDVGKRLALWALASTYKKNVECSGPLYVSSRKFADRMELTFSHAARGLVLTGCVQGNGFQIAGEDRVFKPAEVSVRGSKLVVFRKDVSKPQAVRYAFTNTAQGTLFNTDGLPSPSFRTDDWKP